jgi:hypothetical protein
MMGLNEAALTAAQKGLVELPFEGRVFLEGPYGAGKTAAGAARLLRMLVAGARGGRHPAQNHGKS